MSMFFTNYKLHKLNASTSSTFQGNTDYHDSESGKQFLEWSLHISVMHI